MIQEERVREIVREEVAAALLDLEIRTEQMADTYAGWTNWAKKTLVLMAGIYRQARTTDRRTKKETETGE